MVFLLTFFSSFSWVLAQDNPFCVGKTFSILRPTTIEELVTTEELKELGLLADETSNIRATFTFRGKNLTDSKRLSQSERVLGRELNPAQRQAIIDTHNNGQMARTGNYGPTLIAPRVRRLREAGFDIIEAWRLMENGLVGVPPSVAGLSNEQLSFLESLSSAKKDKFINLLNKKAYTRDEIQYIFDELERRSRGHDSFDPEVLCFGGIK